MITIRYGKKSHVVVPTMFPDGTSQVWKLPEKIFKQDCDVVWHFEAEREIIDILALSELLAYRNRNRLIVPFMPYARQDKPVSNDNTFNFKVFMRLLGLSRFDTVHTLDVHNFDAARGYIGGMKNDLATAYIAKAYKDSGACMVLYPDAGAYIRYASPTYPCVVANKVRDPKTGTIIEHSLNLAAFPSKGTALIVDDICDGGATFINLARIIKARAPGIDVCLYVTHGLFSKGRQVLHDAGISRIFTTDSILKNKNEKDVFRVEF